MSSTSDTINIKGNRKVIRATYYAPDSIFKIPDGLDVEDKTVVEYWGVKYNRLYIHYVDGREEDIYPTLDAVDSSDFKHPQETEIVDADDCGCIEYSDSESESEVSCVKCSATTPGEKGELPDDPDWVMCSTYGHFYCGEHSPTHYCDAKVCVSCGGCESESGDEEETIICRRCKKECDVEDCEYDHCDECFNYKFEKWLGDNGYEDGRGIDNEDRTDNHKIEDDFYLVLDAANNQ